MLVSEITVYWSAIDNQHNFCSVILIIAIWYSIFSIFIILSYGFQKEMQFNVRSISKKDFLFLSSCNIQYCICGTIFLSSKHKAKCLLFFFFFFPVIETPLSPTRITFRVEVCKDANNSSYLCFDICLLAGGLFLGIFFKTNVLDQKISSH